MYLLTTSWQYGHSKEGGWIYDNSLQVSTTIKEGKDGGAKTRNLGPMYLNVELRWAGIPLLQLLAQHTKTLRGGRAYEERLRGGR
jgi:hypothetical protein